MTTMYVEQAVLRNKLKTITEPRSCRGWGNVESDVPVILSFEIV